jgi:hypothetical protein
LPYYQNDVKYNTLSEALERNTVDELKKFIKLLPTLERPTRKAEIIALVARHMEGDSLCALWEQLDELQKAAVAEATHSTDGRFYHDRFRAKYGKDPVWGTGGRYAFERTPSLLGLFIYGSFMPDDLRSRLRAFVPPPMKTALKTEDDVPAVVPFSWEDYDYKTRTSRTVVEEVPVVRREMERAALHDLHAVHRLISTGKVAVSDKTLFPTAGTVKLIASVLQGGDFYEVESQAPKKGDYEEEAAGPIRAFAWPMIVQAGRLAELSGRRLSLTRAGQKALSTPPAETLRAVWNGWLKTTVLDELRRINHIRGQTGKGKRGLTAASGRRAKIAKALADCPVGRWIHVDDFLRYMRAANHDFEVTRDLWSLYIADPYYGSLYEGGDTWLILQGRYTLAVLFEYAATLGIIDVAYVPPAGARQDCSDFWGADDFDAFSRYDGLIYFRLTPLGAYCLGVTTDYAPAPLEVRPALRVMPNLEVAAIEPLSPSETLLLDIYADRVSESLWRLSQSRVLAAMEDGHSVQDLRELLEARSSHELPATVRRFLDDIAERSSLLKNAGPARLIECVDHAPALLIAGDTRTRPFCFLAGERHVVVPAEFETQFQKALRQMGYIIPASPGSRKS